MPLDFLEAHSGQALRGVTLYSTFGDGQPLLPHSKGRSLKNLRYSKEDDRTWELLGARFDVLMTSLPA